ncbi:MAG TPA: aldehyde dehydrogenase family protein, partial [Thermoanaerobaculia bacterium]|nr:aldehyde dehydrogenase family protein [Thermoanaerobaculia bacterium]
TARERRAERVDPEGLDDSVAQERAGRPRDALRELGPVVTIEEFGRFDDAIRSANATRYGLQASVFTRDVGRVMEAFEGLEVGGVIVNEAPTLRIDNFPYGGTKASGFGREGVRYAIEEMTERRVLFLRTPAAGSR